MCKLAAGPQSVEIDDCLAADFGLALRENAEARRLQSAEYRMLKKSVCRFRVRLKTLNGNNGERKNNGECNKDDGHNPTVQEPDR